MGIDYKKEKKVVLAFLDSPKWMKTFILGLLWAAPKIWEINKGLSMDSPECNLVCKLYCFS
jgi:hypothetical protein